MVSLGNVKSVSLIALAVVVVIVIWRSAPGIQQSLGTLGGGLTQSISNAGGGVSGFFSRLGGRIGDSIVSGFTSGWGFPAVPAPSTTSPPTVPAPDQITVAPVPDGINRPVVGIPPPVAPDPNLNAPPGITPPGIPLHAFPVGANTNRRIPISAINALPRQQGLAELERLAAQGYELSGDYLRLKSGRPSMRSVTF